MTIRHLAVALAVLAFTINGARAETIGFSVAAAPAQSDLAVLVLADATQTPITDAEVRLGDTLDSRSVVTLRTDAAGRVNFGRLAAGPKAVTVTKSGQVRISVVGVQAGTLTVFLKPTGAEAPEVMATGQMSGWFQDKTKGNKVKEGLVFRTIKAMDLLEYNVNALVSPLKDTIDVFGERRIPSNLVLPDQRVSVIIGSVHLNKPVYRLPLVGDQKIRLAGIQGETVAMDMIGATGPFDLLNKTRFRKLAMSDPFDVRDDFSRDIEATINLAPAYQVTASRPPFAADVLVTAFADLGGDRQDLLPTDVKLAAAIDSPSTVTPVILSSPAKEFADGKRMIATVAMANEGARLSGIVTNPAAPKIKTGEFLSAAAPAAEGPLPATVAIRAPAKGLGAAVFQARVSATGSSRVFPAWIVYSLPLAGAVAVPTREVAGLPGLRSYSQLQLEFDPAFDERNVDGRAVMTKLQRFSRTNNTVR